MGASRRAGRFRALALVAAIGARSAPTAAEEAKDAMALRLKQNVVRIEVSRGEGEVHRSVGFGFIVGEAADNLYIATARHLLSGSSACWSSSEPFPPSLRVEVRLCQGGATPISDVTVLDSTGAGPKPDVAVLRILRPVGFAEWHRQVTASHPARRGQEVWFIRQGQHGECEVPTNPASIDPKGLPGRFQVNGLAANVGDSGTPLVAQEGLIGMFVCTQGTVAEGVTVDTIERAVGSVAEGAPYNLTVVPNDGPATRSSGIGITLPWVNRRIGVSTLAGGLATAVAVLWERSEDGTVAAGLDRYRAASSTPAATSERIAVERAEARRNVAKATAIGTAVLTGISLVVDLARRPPPSTVASSSRPGWQLSMGVRRAGPHGAVAVTLDARF